MSQIQKDFKYSKSHEWVRVDEDGTVFVGISDHAQESLGDITYVEMPEDGRVIEKGEVFGVVESVKAASDLYMPVGGEVLEVNPDIDGAPELVNNSPYQEGWMLHVKPKDLADVDQLLDAHEYQTKIGEKS